MANNTREEGYAGGEASSCLLSILSTQQQSSPLVPEQPGTVLTPSESSGKQVPAASPAAAAGPRPARHELASARHRVRKRLTHSLAGCHSAKLLTNSSGCLPERPGAAAPASERHLEGVIFQAVLVVIPPGRGWGGCGSSGSGWKMRWVLQGKLSARRKHGATCQSWLSETGFGQA